MARSAAASFLGSHTNRIDAKGRIAAPADFRKALDLSVFNGFFCIPSLSEPALDCGGPDYVEGLKASIYALDPFDPDRKALEKMILGRARPVTFDGDGRFILPKPLREHAALEAEARFVGLGDRFQIARPSAAEASEEEDAARALAALTRLRNPGAAGSAEIRPAAGGGGA